MDVVISEEGDDDCKCVLGCCIGHQVAAKGIHPLDVAGAWEVDRDTFENGKKRLLATALTLSEVNVVGQCSWDIIKDTDQLGSVKFLV